MRVSWLAALALTLPAPGQDPPPRFAESVEVERLLLDVRVIGDGRRAVRDLTAADFEVEVGGREARVESASWVDGSASRLDAETRQRLARAGFPLPQPGRSIVFLFQKDLRASRLPGLIQLKQRARKTLERLAPADRVALLSFDSRLRLWLDFTTDREAVARALDDSVLFGRAPTPPADAGRPGGLRFDAAAAREAASIEQGLLVLARALQPLPGPKSVLFFGHGFGGLVAVDAAYGPARSALRDARAAVFAIDVTQADRHSMEVGLQQLGWDTGGFYASAYHFPGQAMSLAEAALDGHYALVVERPAGLAAGRNEVRVRLAGRGGRVLAPPSVFDR
jgi:VWFA-related protein